MNSTSLLRVQHYSLDWVKDFYDQDCLWWGGFGIGSDADRRRLLRRSAPEGCVLMDVYSPVLPARRAGTAVRLSALESSGIGGDDRAHLL